MNEQEKNTAPVSPNQPDEQARDPAAVKTQAADATAESKEQACADGKEAKKQEKSAIKLAARLEKELDETKKQLEKTSKERDDAKDTLMRTAAEYDNYRKRTTREKEASFSDGVSSAVTQLLPVIDTLELAICAPTSDENYKKGVEMTLEKCRQAFEKLGIEEIEAEGKPFDPNLHNAMMQDAAGEGVESGTITRVLQKGYTLSGKVIRHAAVAVAQ